jgi:hypothetical protein
MSASVRGTDRVSPVLGKPHPRAPLAPVAVTAMLGATACGSASTPARRPSSLGRTVATVTAVSTSQVPTGRRASPEGRDMVHLPPPPSPRAARSRAILGAATAFARAYLRYQIGDHPPAVENTLRRTCTPSFARLLLARPAVIPPGDRGNGAYEPADLTSVLYAGTAALGPGPPAQIVIAQYRGVRKPKSRGQLTIHVTPTGGTWHVAGLG